jgi:hypothetical protein
MITSKTYKQNHLYYDISVLNNTNKPIVAKLFENRTSALLTDPSQYYLSVVRFLIPTAYLPIFIWNVDPILLGNNPNNAYYSVTIRRVGVDHQSFLTYVPQNNLSVLDDNYLYVYSYQQFIDAINIALSAAYLATGGSATTPPYLIYNAVTGLISLVAEYQYANTAGEYEIYFNNNVFSFFDNFKAKRFTLPAIAGKDTLIYVQNNGNNDYMGHAPGYSIAVGNDSYIMTQESNALFNWNDVRSIVLISNTMGVADEAINTINSRTPNTGNSYRKILTDFEPDINSNLRSYLQYNPTAEYRLIDLVSTSPLYTVDVQIFFQTSDQVLHPLFINSGEYLSLKIMFRNKKIKAGL